MIKLSARFIRARIKTIKNIQKITRAMMLIASTKFAKAQEKVKKVLPYTEALQEIIKDIATREEHHPFLAKREEEKGLIIVISSERGLCGSFNINVLKEAEHLLKDSKNTSLITIGKKASLYFSKKTKILKHYPTPEKEPMKLAEELGDYITKSYLEGEFDKVLLVYNEFISIFRQKPQIFQVLPILTKKRFGFSYIYEPDRETCLNAIFPIFFRFQILKAFLSSLAGEYAARMLAMENATRNAEDIIEKLFLTYNQARQAMITKEITEITTTSSAL